MVLDEMFDVLPGDAAWGHEMAKDADGLDLHYVRQGEGSPTVLLLHGWPGFWYDWRRVLPRLAQTTSVIAMDLRGFGGSAKPDLPPREAYSPEAQVKNVLALLDALQIEKVVVAGYDIGGRVATTLARTAPQRVQALIFSNAFYPGFGTRPLEPEAQKERWYQHFHTIEQADQIIGHDRETVRLYLSYFYDHWLGNKQSLRPKEFEAIVDAYTQPGAVRASIAWYRAGAGSGQVAPQQEKLPPIERPTAVVWGATDPILLPAWTDRLGETFSHLVNVQILPDVGHFVPFEAPDVLVEAIRSVL
ncbi:MAG: alpha/beta hydrolase [Ktedonobacteraceae bacterium]|nr:alpha/beta hydrolase [Ktedonobacteraceae bacterium]